MLTEICGYLNNWFTRNPNGKEYPKFRGIFSITDGVVRWHDGSDLPLKEGQYYRIIGGVFNNGGVYRFTLQPSSQETEAGATPKDETFEGEIWSMAVPPDVVALDAEITAWNAKFGKADSEAMSPFNSESFGGYSYSKGGSTTGSVGVTWKSVFADSLTRYKKL